MHRLAAPLIALLVLAAAPATAATPTFGYTPAPPRVPAIAGINGRTISLGVPGERPTSALIVTPEKLGLSMPAVLWVHWLGEPPTTNHTEFLGDAQGLAARGVVSLLVDMPWSQKDWFTAVRTPEHDYDDITAQVISLRRALDYLASIPGVDPARIAYVGHDFGAMDGALLLAVDDRPKFAVLMTPTLSFWEWDLLGKQPADRDAYVAQMSAFDLPGWLARGRQSATLLQFANKDAYVSQATGLSIRNAVPDRDRTFKRYDADHDLGLPAAHDDRRAWLLAHLGV